MRSLLLLACLLAPVQVLAMEAPVAGPLDSRVRVIDYKQLQLVRLCSTGLTPLTLVLDDGEHVGQIAGLMVDQDKKTATDWYASYAANIVTLQPLHEMKKDSVLSISAVTADNKIRPYQFELCTRDGDIANQADPGAYMTVQFRYPAVHGPADPSAAAAEQARRQAARDAAEERAIRVKFAQAQAGDPVCRTAGGTRNCDYSKQGDEGCPILAPTYSDRAFVFDDGLRTTLRFPPNWTVPAVLVLNQDNQEAVQTPIMTTTQAGLEVMLPTVYRYILLRRGGKSCRLRNNAPDPYGQMPGGGTGTISPDVQLQARSR